MKHNTHSRARNKSAWIYGSIKPASPELIEAANNIKTVEQVREVRLEEVRRENEQLRSYKHE